MSTDRNSMEFIIRSMSNRQIDISEVVKDTRELVSEVHREQKEIRERLCRLERDHWVVLALAGIAFLESTVALTLCVAKLM